MELASSNNLAQLVDWPIFPLKNHSTPCAASASLSASSHDNMIDVIAVGVGLLGGAGPGVLGVGGLAAGAVGVGALAMMGRCRGEPGENVRQSGENVR